MRLARVPADTQSNSNPSGRTINLDTVAANVDEDSRPRSVQLTQDAPTVCALRTKRRALVFSKYRIKDTDTFVFRYRGRLLRVGRSKVRVEPDDTLVYSLIFALVTVPPAQRDLVVQLDEHAESEFTKPADPRKTLLDVVAGDGIVHRGRCETVKSATAYRTSECR